MSVCCTPGLMSRVTSAQWPMKRALEGAIVLYALRISRGVPSMEPAALKESLSSGLYLSRFRTNDVLLGTLGVGMCVYVSRSWMCLTVCYRPI